jgi:hypothetical protein
MPANSEKSVTTSIIQRNSFIIISHLSQPMFRSVLVLACAVAVAHAQSVQSACKSIAIAPTAGICKGAKFSGMACVPSTMTADSYASVVMSLCAARDDDDDDVFYLFFQKQ